ncbi:MAG: short-chain dehydrogenase/reductase [SAR324 cluster bacterium]|nr:short-chain dehydrogenase/reductase [SAR324 cluster bacterium]
MDLDLKGRSVLITGGSKGIGRAAAEGFAAEGCNLHLVARTEEQLEAAKEELQTAHGVQVAVHPMDLSQPGAVDQLIQASPDADILVNNAGAIPGGNLDAIEEERWREAWDLKVFGYINMTREYYRRMRERGGGVIVNVIGMAGERPDAGYVAGSAGNASLMAFTRAVGSRSLDDGIRVTAINPGLVETERAATLLQTRAEMQFGDRERWREFYEPLPLGRAAKAQEVADLVVFLASARASYISGTVYTIDGGASGRSG